MRVDPERVWRDLMTEAFTAASAKQWRRRAEAYRWARPRPTDRPGRDTTVESRREQWRRLTAMAVACDLRADALERGYYDDAVITELDDFDFWEAA
ncbi:hypothetical protein FXB39_00660 [Nocardioides sp. BGMRC 2183]|nr:hypothetical protein FXB39_00660 [Nocardioides sp. BGMRC 2183]